MIKTISLSYEHEKKLTMEVNYLIDRNFETKKIISINFVYNTLRNVYTAFIVYEEE